MTGTGARDEIEAYLAPFGPDQRAVLQRVREAIHRGAPGGQEKIRYGMPAVLLGRHWLHFAGWKQHVGVYPVPPVSEALGAEIARYRRARGSLAFAWSEPVPHELIERIAAAVADQRQ